MDNINCNCQQNNLNNTEVKSEINAEEKNEDLKAQCISDKLYNTCGIDSSLLFFFLILVCIVCQSDCDISMETLLWFFLLLVVLWNKNIF